MQGNSQNNKGLVAKLISQKSQIKDQALIYKHLQWNCCKFVLYYSLKFTVNSNFVTPFREK